MPDDEKVARRRFIKDAAVAGATVAASGVLCATPAAAASVPYKWDKEADVLVIGSGAAGMCAAVEAADAGAKVIVLEKEAQVGGVTKLGGGAFMVAGTDVQARLKIEDSPDWLYEDMMEASEMTAVPELIRTFVDNGPELILWLQQLGVKFAYRLEQAPNQRVARVHLVGNSPDYPGGYPAYGGSLGLMLMLFRAANERGVTTLLRHKMSHLIRADASSPVIGVEVNSEGKNLRIKANRAVVVATGGYGANPQMCMAEDPRLTPEIYASGMPYVRCFGEGHVAAMDVGATLSTMSYSGYLAIKWGSDLYSMWEPPTFATVPISETLVGVKIFDFERVILVKGDGKRYVNEMLGSTKAAPPAYPELSMEPGLLPNHPFNEAYLNLKERPRNAWAVTDTDGAEALRWQIDQMRKPDPKSGVGLYPDMVATADNLNELSSRMGLDPVGLATTVAKYNNFVDAGRDADFYKPKLTHKIIKGPFYAAKLRMMNHTRRNGIRVNSRSQVLDRSDLLVSRGVSVDQEKTIPHLYAAGECANYLGRYHLHNTLGLYSFYGRVAGKNAAEARTHRI